MTINQEIRCPVCRQPFVNNDLVELDAVHTIYHVGCEGNFVEPSRGFGTYEEVCKRDGFLMMDGQVH